MAWTAPATWSAHAAPTDADFNAQIRDNFTVLKVCRDANGRLTELSSATLASLSSANVTGLAHPSGANDFAAGRTRFIGTSRVVLPVGADRWSGTKGVDAAGSWVEGDYLHHIASNYTTEWRYLGTLVAHQAAAAVGSLWVEGDHLHYVDADGDERYCEMKGTVTVHTDAAALGGSAWVETYTHIVRETAQVEKVMHADVTHSDHSDHNDHTDHGDSGPHTDHSDHTDGATTHGDHTDHTDHYDGVHADTTPFPHEDHSDHSDHTDHGDTGVHTDHSDHGDGTPHSDVQADNRPVVV